MLIAHRLNVIASSSSLRGASLMVRTVIAMPTATIHHIANYSVGDSNLSENVNIDAVVIADAFAAE